MRFDFRATNLDELQRQIQEAMDYVCGRVGTVGTATGATTTSTSEADTMLLQGKDGIGETRTVLTDSTGRLLLTFSGSLNDLSDVTITSPADNEVLGYDTATSTWINQTAAEAGLATLSFTTISCPAGTNPVADSSTGTLNLAAGAGITITGNSTTDTITIACTITASNSFATIDCPSGTDPVADSATDTLTLTAGGAITITGDSATDTITISESHSGLTNNPHSVTYTQAGAEVAGAVGTHEGTYDHTLLPSEDEKDALAGTSGSPGTGNEYVTDDDPRNTDARTPASHNNTYHSETYATTAQVAAHGQSPLKLCATFGWTQDAGTWTTGRNAGEDTYEHITNTSAADADQCSLAGVFLAVGTYTLRVYGRVNTNMGIVDYYIDTTEVASLDWYAAASDYNVAKSQANIAVATAGLKTIKAKLDGKHASSTGYVHQFQYIQLTRTA